MAVNLSMLAGAGAQFFDNNGVILSGGLLYTYAAGTTTPQAAYTSSSGSTAHSNPIVLDSAGRVASGGEIWLTDAVAYKFVLQTSAAVTIATYDNVTGNASGVAVGIYAAFAASSGSSLVGYLPAGTGAVATTVQTKLRQYVSVFDFMTSAQIADVQAGTLTVDVTSAIQAAIDAVFTAGGGGVFVPGGKYRITSSITVKKAVTLFAYTSQAERLSAAVGVSALFRCYGTGYDAVKLGTTANDAFGAGIIGISIFYAPQAGIVAYSHGMLIDSCAVTYAAGTGIKLVSGSGPTLIQNTHVISPGMHGIEVATADCRMLDSEVQQPNNVATGLPANTYDCISLTATAGPFQIINCRMGDDGFRSRHGIYAAGGQLQISNTDIQNCTIAGIYLNGGNSHIIVGNKIASSSANANKCGVYVEVGSLNSVISSNSFNGITTGGLGGIVIDGAQSYITIASNSFYGNWANATAIVFPTATDRLLITNSSIEGAQGFNKYAYERSETISGATPVIHPAGYNEVLVNVVNAGATTMTSMTGGIYGQRMTLYFGDANTTVQHGTGTNNFRLNSGANVTPTARSTMTFIYTYENKFHLNPLWIEVGRTIY